MLNEQLKHQIVQEAQEYDSQFKHGTGYREPAFFDGANKYAEKWQQAEEKAERYEKALNLITQFSDPGDYWKAICQMKSIAAEALTPKTGEDDHR